MSQPAAKQQQLQDAFELFTQVSEQLTGSYQVLEKQVASLNAPGYSPKFIPCSRKRRAASVFPAWAK